MKRWHGALVAILILGAASRVYGVDYYTHGSFPASGSPATSASMRAELDLISTGFSKLPSLSGNANKPVIVNGSANALTVTTGTLSLAGNFAISGAFATTLTVTNTTNVTLPLTGTLATLAGSETFTTKTFNLANNTLTGTVAQFNTALSDGDFATLAGAESLSNKTVASPILSGTVTGTYTLGGTPTITAPAISSPVFSGSATGTYTLAGTPTITAPAISSPVLSGIATGTYSLSGTPTINAGTVGADPTDALGIASKQYVDAVGFSTGDVKLSLKTVADTSWVLMDDKSIGSATSGATGRANADTSALYTLIWTNVTDQWAPVAGGRGGSAAADFAANKALTLPKTLGRALAGYGTGTVVASGVDADVDITANDLTVVSNNTKWITGMPVVFTLASGTITGLTTSTTYYVIRSSATKVQLASTLANAQNGTAIDYTAKSSPVWTITHTYTSRVLGEAIGEEAHAESATEQLAHAHLLLGNSDVPSSSSASGIISWSAGANNSNANSQSTGGNAAMNNMQPTLFLNVMVKLRAGSLAEFF